jgi:autotransporter-associated beta strand protein
MQNIGNRPGDVNQNHSIEQKNAKSPSVARLIRRAKFLALAVGPMAAAMWASPAMAQLTWDPGNTGGSGGSDGSGNWDTATANWWNGTGDVPWINTDVASIGSNVVGEPAGIITIDDASGTVNASGINFNPVSSGSYTIAASSTDALTLSGAAAINVASGVTPTISAPIAGTAGLNYTGADATSVLTLSGNNTFTGGLNINSGGIIVNPGGNLGDPSNAVTLGSAGSGTLGALTLQTGGTTTIASLTTAVNSASPSTLTINGADVLNVNSNNSLTPTGINGVFVLGATSTSVVTTTALTVSGTGTLNVNGGNNNSSFLVGLGAFLTSTPTMTATLNMSGLANFSFTTGTGTFTPTSTVGGNEFAVGAGNNTSATLSLASASSNSSNMITAPLIDIGDSAATPGDANAVNDGQVASSTTTVNLGAGTNVFAANNIAIGAGRETGIVTWPSTTTTGSLTITGAAGGASTANITVDNANLGTPPSSGSMLSLAGHSATVQAGTVIVGEFSGTPGAGKAGTVNKGTITFDTGTFSVANLELSVATAGTTSDAVSGIFDLGSAASSTGVLNVTNSFLIGDDVGGSNGGPQGNFTVVGGTANIGANIIDVSTVGSSTSTFKLSGGTVNMEGFAIGPDVSAGNTGTVGKRHVTIVTLPTGTATLASLGGTGINDAGLNMNNTGTLILAGTDTYSGGTTLTSGIIELELAAGNMGVGAVSFAGTVGTSGGILQYGAGNSEDVSSLGVTFTSAGPGAGIDTGTNSVTYSNAIGGTTSTSAGLTKFGTGTLALNGANTYSGPTTVVSGILNAGTLPAGGIAGGVGKSTNAAANLVLDGGTLQYTGSGASTDRLFTVNAAGGAIDSSGSGTLVFTNAGANVSADPLFTGHTGVTGATATTKITIVGGLNSVNDLAAGLLVSDTALGITNDPVVSVNYEQDSITVATPFTAAATTNAVTFSYAAAPSNTRTLSLTGTNTGANTISGTLANSSGGGVLALAKTGVGTWVLGGNNTYTGGTSLNGGVLNVNNTGALGSSGTISFGGSGGTLQYSTNNQVDYSARIANSTNAISIDTNGQGVTYASGLPSSNVGGLTKLGGGTLTLQGANTYLGNTTIKAGTLALTGTATISGSTLINVGDSQADSGAIFDVSGLSSTFVLGANQTLAGHGTVNGSVIASAGSTFTPGGSIGTTTYNNNLDVSAGSTATPENFNYTLGTPGTSVPSSPGTPAGEQGSLMAIAGLLNIPSATNSAILNLIDNAGANAQGSIAPGTYELFSYGTMEVAGGAPSGFNSGAFSVNTTNAPGVAGDTFNVFNNAAGQQIDLTITAVPEPATIAGLGVGALMMLRRRRSKS